MSSRKGSKIQTKRNNRNKYRWEKQVNHAVRSICKAKYFKLKSRGE